MRPSLGSFLLRALCTFTLSALAGQASAVDVYGTAGGGNDVGVYEVGLSWAPWKTWPLDPSWSLSLSPTAGVALWYASGAVTNKSLVDFRAYPVLRLDCSAFAGFAPYVEGSIGLNVLTHTWIDNLNRQLSTAFQFGEFIGAGIAFGARREFDIGVRYQHVSNADIKKPNDGLTFGSVVFQYRFALR